MLDVSDGALMEKVYRNNSSGWIKIAVARDPVTRLLSSYLDIVRTWRAGIQTQASPGSPVLTIRIGSAGQQVRFYDDVPFVWCAGLLS